MSNDRLNVYNNYIKKHSLSGLKSGLKYAVYCYIGGTIFASLMIPLCLAFGANTLANLLIFPLAMLISNTIAWVVIGVIFVMIFAAAIAIAKPLFHLTKDLISKMRAQKKEKSEEKDIKLQELQEPTLENPERSITLDRPKTPDNDTDSGVITLGDNGDSGDINSNNEDNKSDFADKTNKGDYECWLSGNDIIGIAENLYKWNINGEKTNPNPNVFFAYSYVLANLETYLAKYKSKVEQGDSGLMFTSILHLRDGILPSKLPFDTQVGENNQSVKRNDHFVTLVISHDKESKKFRAYYCDSFGKSMQNDISDVLNNTLGIDSSDIGSSKEKQQTDSYNCGIFALENAEKITGMMRAGKSFDEISKELSEYKPSPKELEEKRKKFAEVLEHNRSRRISGDSAASLDSGISVGSKESKQTKKAKIVTYSTAGDGNCFFHAVFGSNNSGTYRAERAQEMREEWHKFLNQFKSLKDPKMSTPLKEQLQKVFNMFLIKPGDLTDRSDTIKELAQHTNKKIAEADSKVKELKDNIVRKFHDDNDFKDRIYNRILVSICERNERCPNDQKSIPSIQDLLDNEQKLYNEIEEDLESCALVFDNSLSSKQYANTYDPKVIKDSFLNDAELYKAYLEAISNQNYYVFAEEISILASLANIIIEFYAKDTDNSGKEVTSQSMFLPNRNMINSGYEQNGELWGDKKEETIYLSPGHYERAEVVTLTSPLSKTESVSSVQSVLPYCPIV